VWVWWWLGLGYSQIKESNSCSIFFFLISPRNFFFSPAGQSSRETAALDFVLSDSPSRVRPTSFPELICACGDIILEVGGLCASRSRNPKQSSIVLPENTVESVDSGTDSAGSVTDNAEDDAEGDQSWGVISMISGVFGLLFGMGDVTDRQLEPTERETIADNQITVVSEFATAPGTVGSETASIVNLSRMLVIATASRERFRAISREIRARRVYKQVSDRGQDSRCRESLEFIVDSGDILRIFKEFHAVLMVDIRAFYQ
jgi:hypothetical protein